MGRWGRWGLTSVEKKLGLAYDLKNTQLACMKQYQSARHTVGRLNRYTAPPTIARGRLKTARSGNRARRQKSSKSEPPPATTTTTHIRKRKE